MIIQVSPSLNIFETLSYRYTGDPTLLKPGLRVIVPVGKRITPGWIIDTHSHFKGTVKDIIAVVQDGYIPGKHYLNFAKAISEIYFTSTGLLLDAALPPSQKPISAFYFQNKEKNGKIEKINKYSYEELLEMSSKGALDVFYKSHDDASKARGGQIHHSLQSLPEADYAGTLVKHDYNRENKEKRFIIGLHRDDRYQEIVQEYTGQGKSVLIIVPDSLTASYLAQKLAPVSLDLYNSEIKPKERETTWYNYAINGKAGVVIGGQSAVFLPIANLGIIICDRAGSSIYDRNFFSKYNIRFLAEMRALHFNVSLLEGFSSHTVRSFHERPQIFIEDKRGEKITAEIRMVRSGTRGIPPDFIELVNHYALENKKILVILNKKESFNFLYCAKCKRIIKCTSCDGTVNVDENFNIKCIRCGLEKKSLTTCDKCGEALILVEDISIASVKKTLKKQVIETGIMTLSADGLKEEHLYSLLRRIEDSKVIISTPVILNPVFNNMFDAVLYLRPESYFNINDYDGAEKIFYMTGELRELIKKGGTLDIFSTFHFHYALKLINDEESFFGRELKYREWFHLPPFANVYHIEIKDRNLRKLGKEMRNIYKKFKDPLNIKRIYLGSRQPVKGSYKGLIEAHTQPEGIIESGLLENRNIFIHLILV
ncbi:MAG: hypothetical protein MUF15_17965 [Acidobacteria bacterium]|jgi:primosomal protein N'|nr:hypothetical protein [Acidobacteriota bacterium]